MQRFLTASFALVACCIACSPALAIEYGPTPYLSFADSPFASIGATQYFYLEDFEDGALNTPGVTVTSGAIVAGPSSATDSVDADDGAIDGSGLAGHSLFSNAALTSFEFTFNSAALGGLPNLVGIVWTDVGFVTSGNPFEGPVTAQIFDLSNNSLGVIGPSVLGGDGTVAGATAEDRFLGFYANGNDISRLVISMSNSVDWEVDHLQYGRLIPEPAAVLLAGIGFLALGAAIRPKK
jgi:hypothetical protein